MSDSLRSRRELMQRASESTKRGDWPEAIRRWTEIRERYPANPSGYINGSKALRSAGCLDAAEALVSDAMMRFAGNESIAVEYARVAAARRDWSEALRRWGIVRTRHPERVEGYVGGAEALQSVGRLQEAVVLLDEGMAALGAAKATGLDERTALTMELDFAKARNDWQRVRVTAKRLIAKQTPPSASALLALSRAQWHLKDLREAEDSALRALAVEPTLVEAALICAWIAAEQADGEKLLHHYRRLAQLQPATPRWPLQIAQTLNILGRVGEARDQLNAVVSQWYDHPSVRINDIAHSSGALVRFDGARRDLDATKAGASVAERAFPQLMAKSPRDDELRRPLIIDDPTRDVIVCEAEDAKAAILVFTGNNDAFGIPLPIIDRYLAAAGVTAIYLKDFNRLLYLKGIQSLGQDYQTTLRALRDILARLGLREIYAIGHSSGGFGAIRYGVELNARRIVCFSAKTSILSEPTPQFRILLRIATNRYRASLSPHLTNLRSFLEKTGNSSELHLYYGDGEETDRAEAFHLHGLPGVSLHQVAGVSEHNVIRPLVERGAFRDVVARILDFQTPEDGSLATTNEQ